ncbi:MAG: Uma2 family endonuclease [Spirochaetaceae bacterium]|nr:Uma2 family endonuclease [Spirochaetaceae bacterium]
MATASGPEQIAELLPLNGRCSAEEYLWLSARTNHLVELAEGSIEILPVPTDRHQAMVEFLFLLLYDYASRTDGKARFAPLRLRIAEGRFREPDILYLRAADDGRRGERFWTGADLVMEVVSPDDPARDHATKRNEYAEAGIAEYWIVDPQDETITVLRLAGQVYVEHGRFVRGQMANSALLAGLSADVTSALDAE